MEFHAFPILLYCTNFFSPGVQVLCSHSVMSHIPKLNEVVSVCGCFVPGSSTASDHSSKMLLTARREERRSVTWCEGGREGGRIKGGWPGQREEEHKTRRRMKKKKEGKKELEIKDYSDIKSAIDNNSGGIRFTARGWWVPISSGGSACTSSRMRLSLISAGNFLARSSQRVKYSGRPVSVGDEGTRESLLYRIHSCNNVEVRK